MSCPLRRSGWARALHGASLLRTFGRRARLRLSVGSIAARGLHRRRLGERDAARRRAHGQARERRFDERARASGSTCSRTNFSTVKAASWTRAFVFSAIFDHLPREPPQPPLLASAAPAGLHPRASAVCSRGRALCAPVRGANRFEDAVCERLEQGERLRAHDALAACEQRCVVDRIFETIGSDGRAISGQFKVDVDRLGLFAFARSARACPKTACR